MRRTPLVLLVFVVAVAAVAGWFRFVVDGDRRLPVVATDVVIPAGSGAAAIGKILHDEGVLSSDLAFRLYVRYHGGDRNLRAGEFSFPAHESLADIVDRLGSGGSQLALWVTIPEGFTAREIAQTFSEKGFGEEPVLEEHFLQDRLRLGDVETESLEGYLFPDTYLVSVASPPRAIEKMMTDEFRAELPRDAAPRARRLGYSVPQIVTVASMIEREGKADDERPTIASVIYNRLHLRMRLEIDATLEYTFARHKDVITNADLALDTPYNTYLHDGLPPTPIANPGKASLDAAFHPASTPFLYYVYAGNGHHAFARTLAEHNANVARYEH